MGWFPGIWECQGIGYIKTAADWNICFEILIIDDCRKETIYGVMSGKSIVLTH